MSPIVPVVSIGGQETQFFLTRGTWLAKRIGLIKRLTRSEIVPIAVGFPFGVTLGGVNLPLPSKIVTQVLPAIDITARFAGAVVHDFNNLLTLIRSHGEFIIEKSEPGDSLRDHASEIRQAADRASLLTRQLLTFCKRQAPQRQLIDLNRLLRDVADMISRLVADDGVTLILRLGETKCMVLADPTQLEPSITGSCDTSCRDMSLSAWRTVDPGGTLRFGGCAV